MVDILRRACPALAALAVLAIGTFSALSIDEAFGTGPPYYGGTTNMDKWSDPTQALITVQLVGVTIAILLVLVCARGPRAATRSAGRSR